MNKKGILIVIVAAAVLALGGWLLMNRGPAVPTFTIAADQTFAGDYSVSEGTRVVVQNGATLTVEGDLLVQGSLVCEGGPLKIVVGGTLIVERHIQCDRPEQLAAGDLGTGIILIAKSFDIGKDAVIISNGHVQVVTDASKIADTQEKIDTLYQEAATYRSEKFHIGPMVPIEQIPKNVPGRPVSTVTPVPPVASRSVVAAAERNVVSRTLVPLAQAQGEVPATDTAGNPVDDTVKVGGTWIVGKPDTPPPFELKVPTPPAGISKIILNFDFGGKDVIINYFDLTGPDGLPGKNADGSCNVTGGDGKDAMRLMVRAANISINEFDLHLGSGGAGGRAETSRDCDPGIAKGGAGGASGNFKMVAEQGFEIVGAFNIYPGKGGAGGKAIAYGKKGEDGCGGKQGGEATSTGGKGGDNKKLLVITGTVAGTDNVTIHEVVGGAGGNGESYGGKGGDGTGPGCPGGPGGKATSTGGKGGDTSCSKFPCTGGDGGTASATPGMGGRGGQGSTTEPGGDGGKGGDAKATGGTGGAGKTANGTDGEILDEKGGDGGNGGDGCGPGSGGAGGNGNPNGNPGADGKNLCVPVNANQTSVTDTNANSNTNTNVNTNSTTNTNTNSNTNSTNANTNQTPQPDVHISVQTYSFTHVIGETECPTPIGIMQLTGTIPAGTILEVDASTLPKWLASAQAGGTQSASLRFTCVLDDYVSQSLNANVKVRARQQDGTVIEDFTVQVSGQVIAR